ncbi:PREDICTED: protein PHYTOCHROME KINASE SUBSTRATE 1-like isoform X2 [Lupinus angustifolius]|uniref:protein PHYTOCHROME KINASE SUBSTRATE 1-like isoform X2 n=1 Tax=Lupinus angustifolius TaxID=3871 RepID=UPI00092E42B6|nr:PREDICTED: protein PHYTOCHROME KINASE SUBSTRATE 1-like isoform X2 [Lupinus angustifolius]
MVIIASTSSNSSIHQLQTFNSQNNNSNNHLRDASFSSYLNIHEKTFAESSQNLDLEGVKKEEDGEIEVFEAEKYFNGEEVDSTKVAKVDGKKYKYQKDEQTALETMEYTIQHGTPSVRSESSWNSQSALLQSSIRNRKNKVKKKSFLAGLGCKCSCSDKNSVDVSDHAGEISFNKTPTYGVAHGKTTPKKLFNADLDANHSVKISKPHAELLINKGVYFQKQENSIAEFSTVNSSLGNQLIKMQLEEAETPRKSLQVFGSPILDRRGKSLTFDKKLAMPSWEGTNKMEEFNFSANSGGKYNDDDAESDASSDLFEIESLTGNSNNTFLCRPTSNVASGCGSPSFYAPSEASIEWSVVTASAVEYSAMSDYEDQRSVATIRSPIRTSYTSSNGKPKASREMPKQRPGMLLGCKSHKAVGVADNAFKTSEKPRSNSQFRRRSDTFSQVTRFQEETKKANFGARHGQHAYAYAAPPLQRSH